MLFLATSSHTITPFVVPLAASALFYANTLRKITKVVSTGLRVYDRTNKTAAAVTVAAATTAIWYAVGVSGIVAIAATTTAVLPLAHAVAIVLVL